MARRRTPDEVGTGFRDTQLLYTPFQPEVVVMGPGEVLLHHEPQLASPAQVRTKKSSREVTRGISFPGLDSTIRTICPSWFGPKLTWMGLSSP